MGLDGCVESDALPQRGVRAPHWGISARQYGQLLVQHGFLEADESLWTANAALKGDMCVREFVQEVVVPATRGRGMGYSLLTNQQSPKQVQSMVSHSWEEGVLELFFALKTVVHGQMDQGLFICFLSIYQKEPDDNVGPSIGEQLWTNALLGPFVEVLISFKTDAKLRLTQSDSKQLFDYCQALSKGEEVLGCYVHCGRMIIVPTKHCNLYTRMWCVLELFMASVLAVPMIVAQNEFGILDPTVTCQNASCGRPGTQMNDDEKSIRRGIESGEGYLAVDDFVQTFRALNKSAIEAMNRR